MQKLNSGIHDYLHAEFSRFFTSGMEAISAQTMVIWSCRQWYCCTWRYPLVYFSIVERIIQRNVSDFELSSVWLHCTSEKCNCRYMCYSATVLLHEAEINFIPMKLPFPKPFLKHRAPEHPRSI